MSKTYSAANAKLQYEAGQDISAMAAMVDAGDHKVFSITGIAPWSQRSGYEPDIFPDGLETGGAVTPGTSNDEVAVAALTCYLAGVKKSVDADSSVTVTRPAASPTGLKKINSITINSSGVITNVEGTDGASFVTTRNAAGGPPFIPVGSIEIAQVKLDSSTAAVVETSEILQVPGSSQERYDYPSWTEDPFTGQITFASALTADHTGSAIKGVYGEVYEPSFVELELASDFVAPEKSHSVSSTQVYGDTVGSSSESLGQGSFSCFLKDGITDAIVGLKDEVLFFKFFPDRNKAPYLLCYGKLGISRTYPAADNIKAACTISAAEEGVGKAS